MRLREERDVEIYDNGIMIGKRTGQVKQKVRREILIEEVDVRTYGEYQSDGVESAVVKKTSNAELK